MASSSRDTPASSAALTAIPKPVVCAPRASSGSSPTMPHASASSTTPLPSGNRSHDDPLGRPTASTTATGTRSDRGTAANASRVPSPPSAMGRSATVSRGRTDSQPAAIRSAACEAVRVPLNESGAITTCMCGSLATST